jgi:hypothetical protein
MICLKRSALLLYLIVAISGATLKDYFNKQFYDETEDDSFLSNYETLTQVGNHYIIPMLVCVGYWCIYTRVI